MSDPPYENYFYSERNVVTQFVVTGPMLDSDLSIIGPRFIVAWPAGDSGACMFLNGVNGSLGIRVINSTVGAPLAPVHISRDGYPNIGVQAVIEFDSAAELALSILGSVRAIRDFTEGPSLLHPNLQEGIKVEEASHSVAINKGKATFEAGEYLISASINYPHLEQLRLHTVLKDESLIKEHQHETKALSFLSYSEKLLAGAWRFLTYFGWEDMISTLLMQPILSEDAVEAVIGSVLERVNRSDGSACYEEVIGDYATFLNLEEGIESRYYNGPSHVEYFDSEVAFHTMALEGHGGLDSVPVMSTDACVRLFFLNGTCQRRLTDYLNHTALSILRPYPAGLMTPLGLVVANPAISGNDVVIAIFDNSAYRGSVIWSWQLVGMAAALGRQLDRCNSEKPDFCSDKIVFDDVKDAYNTLWDSIEQNKDYMSDEVWTWKYEDSQFMHASLGSLPPPPGVGGVAERDVVQLWSLTFLAVKRNEEMR